MAIAANTRIANRYGMALTFHPTNVTGTASDIIVGFANQVTIDITGDAVYATGEESHKRLVGFNNPLAGTMTVSTQVITPDLMKLITGETGTTVGTNTFKSRSTAPTYQITGVTEWKDPSGTMYTETMVAYRALVKPNYSATYSGDGDPHSIDINIELLEDPDNGMVSFTQAQK